MELKILTTVKTDDYELLDSGDGMKLERFGSAVLSRPDPLALWHKNLSENEWQKADGVFHQSGVKASWKMKDGVEKMWNVKIDNLVFAIKLGSFKHTGIFPEQLSNWQFIKENISKKVAEGKKVKMLNLFGYTGGATLAGLSAGAEVCHVDGSKTAINLANENTKLSGLDGKPVRWILEDARKFVEKEVRRGMKYDAIVMDPPAFGHGGKGEVWKIEEDLLPLLEACGKLLSSEPLFVIINGYASGYSAITYMENIKSVVGTSGTIEAGELTIQEKSGRLLPAGIFARWSK